ncbi:MAG: hypothetical protein PHQ86_05455 [Dehalococcoidales bacterium]|nr:hypothetical protein [Dehalococcoidales bacterium]
MNYNPTGTSKTIVTFTDIDEDGDPMTLVVNDSQMKLLTKLENADFIKIIDRNRIESIRDIS